MRESQLGGFCECTKTRRALGLGFKFGGLAGLIWCLGSVFVSLLYIAWFLGIYALDLLVGHAPAESASRIQGLASFSEWGRP